MKMNDYFASTCKYFKTPIRNANLKDVHDITVLFIESIRTHFKGTLPDEELDMWTYENEKKCFLAQIHGSNTKIHIIRTAGGELIGFTRFGVDPADAQNGRLDSIFVKDDFHRKHYGKQLFIDAKKTLREMGFKRMILWTPTKGKAHGFYQKLGGIKCARKVNHISFDLTAYAWPLDEG